MTLEGIDISYAQSTTPSLSGLSFVFVKAGQHNFVDSKWATHSANVRKAGKVLGAYWFWDDRSTAADQAALFLKTAGSADLFALDFEGANSNTAGARAFIAAVQGAGKKCALYHSLSGFPSWGQNYNWVADWSSTPPSIPWTFWQYQGSPLDRDRFRGDEAALAALVSGSTGGGNIPGGDVQYIMANGYNAGSGKRLHVAKGTPILRFDDTQIALLSADADLTVFGLVDAHTGQYAVLVTTGGVNEIVKVKTTAVPTDAPPTPGGDTVHKVELVVDGAVKSTVSV